MADENPRQLLIRFRGICALVARRDANGKTTKEKRAVLVRHRDSESGIEHHIPFIEFYADDILPFSSEVKVLQYSRPGMEERLARIDLDENSVTQITLEGLVAGDVEEAPNFKTDLPHMGEILASDADSAVVDSLLDEPKFVERSHATAFFDMPKGLILAGEPESTITRFEKKVTTFSPRRLARWTDLYVTIKEPIVLQLNNLSTGRTLEVKFSDTLRMLTIGNEPERMILGVMASSLGHKVGHGVNPADDHNEHASPLQPTGHFVLYYDILKKKRDNPPLPIPSQINGRGCPNNVYP